MQDVSVPLSRLFTVAMWSATLALMVTAWAMFLLGQRWLAQMVGYTACTMSAVAATSSIRCYAIRLCRLVRVANGLDVGAARRSEVHLVGD